MGPADIRSFFGKSKHDAQQAKIMASARSDESNKENADIMIIDQAEGEKVRVLTQLSRTSRTL